MRFFKGLLLTTVLILTTGSLAFAADADGTSAEELTDAESVVAEEAAEEQEQPLFEQADVNCMVYGEGAERKYEMIVELVNISDVPIRLIPRTFDLEDADGHLLQSDDNLIATPEVLLPGEHGYISNLYGTLIDIDTPTDQIVFVPSYTVREVEDTPHDYPLSDVTFRTDAEGYTMAGRMQNDTENASIDVEASIVYLDADGKCMGIIEKPILDVGSGETRSFEISAADYNIQKTFDADAIGSYTIYVRDAAL